MSAQLLPVLVLVLVMVHRWELHWTRLPWLWTPPKLPFPLQLALLPHPYPHPQPAFSPLLLWPLPLTAPWEFKPG